MKRRGKAPRLRKFGQKEKRKSAGPTVFAFDHSSDPNTDGDELVDLGAGRMIKRSEYEWLKGRKLMRDNEH